MRILWVSCRLLHPLNGGDRIRTFNMLRVLKRTHEVTYLCFKTPQDAEDAVARATEYCHQAILIPHRDTTRRSPRKYAEIAANTLAGRFPYLGTKYRSKAMSEQIRSCDEEGSADLIICDYQAPMINFLALGSKLKTRVILFQHNVESLIYRRHHSCATHPLSRFLYARQHTKTVRFELESAQFADGQITVSEDDSRIFRDELGMANVLGAVPTGVDFSYFSNPGDRREPHTVAFLGSMDWHANVDAVTWFADNIYPAIRRQFPDARFLVIGRNPDPSILALAARDPSIEVTGTVDDVRPHLRRAAMLVLPLRVGGGTRIKVFEAMAMRLPVVSTGIGVEGLHLTAGDHVLVADDEAAFSKSAIRILESPAYGESIAAKGFDFIRARYSWEQVAREFENLCQL